MDEDNRYDQANQANVELRALLETLPRAENSNPILASIDSYVKKEAKKNHSEINVGDLIPVGVARGLGVEGIPPHIPNHFLVTVTAFQMNLIKGGEDVTFKLEVSPNYVNTDE